MKLHNDGKLINNQKKSHINNNTYFQSLLSLNFALEEDGVLPGVAGAAQNGGRDDHGTA